MLMSTICSSENQDKMELNKDVHFLGTIGGVVVAKAQLIKAVYDCVHGFIGAWSTHRATPCCRFTSWNWRKQCVSLLHNRGFHRFSYGAL
ncbi:uncharacterized protein BJ212DRAFT_891698 [Suillus subaureus]|uniref:Uncharacterized protein n=1 Tax=Suillus subaureus TaxID=48587 RepID=A0A9P7DVT5_9AGAM|nr:uncharacterized protein BJ212DRAFT_891698 [Suillus subaureus]KAG1804530.1 hypothetical protein BJ212DRAFT_891698 [Suillus subaureus]